MRTVAAMSTGPRLLIVDDDRGFRAALARMLTPYPVHLTSDAREALARCAADQIDVVIADVRMWPIDGLELAAEMQRRGLAVPVVVVTSSDPREVRQMLEALALRNVVDVLPKPVSAAALGAVLGRCWDAEAGVITARELPPVVAAP